MSRALQVAAIGVVLAAGGCATAPRPATAPPTVPAASAAVPVDGPAGAPPLTAPSAAGLRATPAPASATGSPEGLARPAAPGTGRRGGYYLDDGPGDRPLPEPAAIADAVPIVEPLHPRANRPYQVFGTDYVPLTARRVFRQRGHASWYGRKFHGQPTSTGERYDMYAMTAAHPTLPLPSYVRVSNLENGRVAVVRVNDRGPFLKDRVIDLSMAAAHKLGYLASGSAPVQIELIEPRPEPDAVPAPVSPAVPPAVDAGATGATATTAAAAAAAVAGAPAATAPTPAGNTTPAAKPAESSRPTEQALATPPSPGTHYVQLAAYGTQSAAELALPRLRAQFDWLSVPIVVVPGGAAVFRVQAGPYPDHPQAKTAAARIEQATGLKPWVVARP